MNTIGDSAILEYMRNKNHQKIGVMLAFVRDDKVHIGWSKCRVKGDSVVVEF